MVGAGLAGAALTAPARPGDPRHARIPRATYRVQLHKDFGFADARARVPYWAALGISHLYTSPVLRARPGSTHGYDVVDHGMLNPELGTRADFDALVDALHAHRMDLLVDVVPNHMGVLGGDNGWWLDVLENGAASAYANHFDIDWASADPALHARVLLPILGDQYGIVLEAGELRLGFDASRGYFTIDYHDHQLPIDPSGYGALLKRALPALARDAAAALGELARAFEQLPPRNDSTRQAERQRDKSALKARLAALAAQHAGLAEAVKTALLPLNGRTGQRSSFDALDALIDAQPYRLANWRVAGDQINYRRFFDINELAALRMEHAEVFDDTHRLLLELCASGAIGGLRIDHPDGLADPAGYFARLQHAYAQRAGLPAPDGTLPLYVVAEKIVAPHEQVPPDWKLHGTTGYRFGNLVNGLFVDGRAKARLDRAWRAFAGDEAQDFETLAEHGRKLVMDGALAGEMGVLAAALLRLARADRRTRDFTLNALRAALTELLAAFPVYRTYIIDKPSAQDRRHVDWAIGLARRRSRAADPSVFDFLRRVLLGRPPAGAASGLGERYREFARRLQQYSAPVTAKGIEDTALYNHQRLVSVNDVGSDPDRFGVSVAAFHAASRERALHRPHTLLATSTHDAKRSEDVRARIDVISEMPAAWRLTVRRWSRLNRRHKRLLAGARVPTHNDEYLLYQTLVGSLPAGELHDAALREYLPRVQQAMLKSVREAKRTTNWMNPDGEYERALETFIDALLGPRDSNLFLADLRTQAATFAWYGALNSLSLVVLKALSPGVPDIYQGCERLEPMLVDPDNRRAVDYAQCERWLRDAQALAVSSERGHALRALVARATDGRAKFHALWCALQLRGEHEAVARDGDYLPLEASGTHAERVVAFARRHAGGVLVAVAPRMYAGFALPLGHAPLAGDWADTSLAWPEGAPALRCAISGRRFEPGPLPLAGLLQDFPVAALGPA